MLMYLVIQSDLFGMVKWPCKRLSDLQVGDKKAPLNHLVGVFFFPEAFLEHMEIGFESRKVANDACLNWWVVWCSIGVNCVWR